jgi:hypothetical protein
MQKAEAFFGHRERERERERERWRRDWRLTFSS